MRFYRVQVREPGGPWRTVGCYPLPSEAESRAIDRANETTTALLDDGESSVVVPMWAGVRVRFGRRTVFNPRGPRGASTHQLIESEAVCARS
jgi:hypothetical protein